MNPSFQEVWEKLRQSHPDEPNIVGLAVRTEHDPDRDRLYRRDAGTRRSAPGVVTNFSDSDNHGLCFQVEHGPGEVAWYEPEEVHFWQSPDNPFSPPYSEATILAAVDLWHESTSSKGLREWLGISVEQYAAYVERGQLPQQPVRS